MRCWLMMFRRETYEIVRSKGVIGVLKNHRERFAALRPGDRFVAYISRERVFDGWGQVAGAPYEDDSPLFPTQQPYPQRCEVSFEATGLGRPEQDALWYLSPFDGEMRTSPANLIFCKGGFLEISESDHELLVSFMKTGAHPKTARA